MSLNASKFPNRFEQIRYKETLVEMKFDPSWSISQWANAHYKYSMITFSKIFKEAYSDSLANLFNSSSNPLMPKIKKL
jgi:hypothetical protein